LEEHQIDLGDTPIIDAWLSEEEDRRAEFGDLLMEKTST
jgi:hypothetical protein